MFSKYEEKIKQYELELLEIRQSIEKNNSLKGTSAFRKLSSINSSNAVNQL